LYLVRLCIQQNWKLSNCVEIQNQLKSKLLFTTNLLIDKYQTHIELLNSSDKIKQERVTEFLSQILQNNEKYNSINQINQVLLLNNETNYKSILFLQNQLVDCQNITKELQHERDLLNQLLIKKSQVVPKTLAPHIIKTKSPTFPPKEQNPPSTTNLCQPTFDFDTTRSGKSYSTQTVTSSTRCKRLCLSDTHCQSWVFEQEENKCELKKQMGVSIPDSCCVSGVRCRIQE
jgi:hypothetical protein